MNMIDAATDYGRQVLLPIQRSVLAENRAALLRRWHLVREGVLNDPRVVNRWFPRQRDLLELLDALGEEEVETLASVGQPLFQVPIRTTELTLNASSSFRCSDKIEEASIHEAFLALTSRLDAARSDRVKASAAYGLSMGAVDWLQKYCPVELHYLARDPSMLLIPAASTEYFMIAATKKMTFTSRTMLATVSRRQPTYA